MSTPEGFFVVVVSYVPEPHDEPGQIMFDAFGFFTNMHEAEEYACSIEGKVESVGTVGRAIVRRVLPVEMGPKV